MIIQLVSEPHPIDALLYQGEPEYVAYLEQTYLAPIEYEDGGIVICNPDNFLPPVFLKEGNWLIMHHDEYGEVKFTVKTPEEFELEFTKKPPRES